MSTHAAIVLHDPKTDTYKGIYCHFDGYIVGGVGEMLFTNYTNEEKVAGLIELGDISILDTELSNTIAYARDRGEKMNPPAVGKSLEDVLDEIDYSYAYLFKDGEWNAVLSPRERY